jgi:hypothetical protein
VRNIVGNFVQEGAGEFHGSAPAMVLPAQG